MIGRFTLNPVSAPINAVHDNTGQEVIKITSDKLELILERHLKNLERRKDWIAPLGLLLAIITTFCAATFKDALLPADTWKAVFFLSGLVSLYWLCLSLWASFRAPAIGDLMVKIKQDSGSQSNTQMQKSRA